MSAASMQPKLRQPSPTLHMRLSSCRCEPAHVSHHLLTPTWHRPCIRTPHRSLHCHAVLLHAAPTLSDALQATPEQMHAALQQLRDMPENVLLHGTQLLATVADVDAAVRFIMHTRRH